jgi:UDP-2,4-diacetamido-2,4,6-trideoxy-beta-L-altropyranose hydrolase
MHVAFRLDASPQIGIGHAMRCLTLADALRRRGASTRFVCRQLPDELYARIRLSGHEVSRLPELTAPEPLDDLAQSALLGTSQVQDARETLLALAGRRWEWLIVDHYAIDARWELQLREAANGIMVIDDVADRDHDCDLLLDQNLHPDQQIRYDARVPATARRLLGPQFALLRPEFGELRSQVLPRDGNVRRLFVLYGGFDAADFTGRTLAVLERMALTDIDVDVVIGSGHPCRAQIERDCTRLGYDCHVQSEEVAQLMSSADLAFGAGGSASWERCCLGLATLCVSFADNQRPIAEALDAAGAAVFAGDEHSASGERIEALLRELLGQPERLRRMSRRAFALVDGQGAGRVCDAIEGRA